MTNVVIIMKQQQKQELCWGRWSESRNHHLTLSSSQPSSVISWLSFYREGVVVFILWDLETTSHLTTWCSSSELTNNWLAITAPPAFCATGELCSPVTNYQHFPLIFRWKFDHIWFSSATKLWILITSERCVLVHRRKQQEGNSHFSDLISELSCN